MLLARIESNQLDHAELDAWLDAYLTWDDDRALFELLPLGQLGVLPGT